MRLQQSEFDKSSRIETELKFSLWHYCIPTLSGERKWEFYTKRLTLEDLSNSDCHITASNQLVFLDLKHSGLCPPSPTLEAC